MDLNTNETDEKYGAEDQNSIFNLSQIGKIEKFYRHRWPFSSSDSIGMADKIYDCRKEKIAHTIAALSKARGRSAIWPIS